MHWIMKKRTLVPGSRGGRSRRTLSFARVFFVKFADLKTKDLGWTCTASWQRALSLLPTARGFSEDALKLEGALCKQYTAPHTHFAHATFSRVWLKVDQQTQCEAHRVPLDHNCLSISRTMSHLHSSWLELVVIVRRMEQREEVLSARRQGRTKLLTATHVTELSEICDRMSGELALPSRVCCDVFRHKLMEWGCHLAAEHVLDEGIPSNVRELQETWPVKSPMSRTGAARA